MYKYLDEINSYEDYKKFNEEYIRQLAKDIRKFLVRSVSQTGGHLASNLGVVELTLATHKVFDLDRDKIIYDVGHQSYVHKILTGRKDSFNTLRQLDGLCGFPKRKESRYDCYNTGHSSTSISSAIGMAISRDILKKDFDIVSIIGDASISSGVALEGLNYLANTRYNILIILNDNEMSISKTVGGIAKLLSNIRISSEYRNLSKKIKSSVKALPVIGEDATNIIKSIKDSIKNAVVDGEIFNKIGFNYFGPIDGHDYFRLKQALSEIKKLDGPKILHIKTVKGKGYKFAMENPSIYHGVGKFDVSKPIKSTEESFSTEAGKVIENIFEKDEKTVLISAAMLDGTGMNKVAEKYPKRVFDVGIEEANAVNIAAGIASQGVKSYVSIYSTFLQRAYDQILHDVCLQNLPVTFLLDRAGVVGQDGDTHQGLYDISYLSHMPNIEIFSPKDSKELGQIILSTHSRNNPVAIRYSKGKKYEIDAQYPQKDMDKWEYIEKNGNSTILAIGKMVKEGVEIVEILKGKNINISLVNARKIKPIDGECLDNLLDNDFIFIMEDSVENGSFSSMVKSYLLKKRYKGDVISFSFPDIPIPHGNIEDVFKKYNMDFLSIANKIEEVIGKK